MEHLKVITPGGGYSGPYVDYTGMCGWTGYGFWPLCPKQGMYVCVSVLNRVCILSFVLNRDLK